LLYDKAIVYTTIALAVIVATRGRLGYRAVSEAAVASHDIETVKAC
jgi:hypothetical protein